MNGLDLFHLPQEMRELNRWVCATGNSKVPQCAYSYKPASVSRPETWSDFDTAQFAVQCNIYPYVGYVFAGDGIVGIDIDKGFDEYGLLSDLSIDCMRHLKSYTEKSRSGRGIHILVKGKLPFNGMNNGNGCEIYETGRYFICTGKTLVFTEMVECQSGLDYIVEKYFANVPKAESNGIRQYNPEWETPQDHKIALLPTKYPTIGEGGRNNAMTSLAGQLRNQGYEPDLIFKELCRANAQACDPPLPETELRMILKSVMRYQPK